MRLRIAFWCKTRDERSHEPGDVIEIGAVEGQMLINDGVARLAELDQSPPLPSPVPATPKASKSS
jgi:hypothetical protein